jgi:hypothetical protein
MNLNDALLWGFIATAVLTMIIAAAQGLGYSRVSLPYMLGTMVTPNRDFAMLVGTLLHLINGWLVAFLYAAIFDSVGSAGVWFGALIGIGHGLFALLVLMPIMPGLHPRMASERQGPTPTRGLQPPGFLALHYGRGTPIVTLVAHLAYGAILGAFYHVPH